MKGFPLKSSPKPPSSPLPFSLTWRSHLKSDRRLVGSSWRLEKLEKWPLTSAQTLPFAFSSLSLTPSYLSVICWMSLWGLSLTLYCSFPLVLWLFSLSLFLSRWCPSCGWTKKKLKQNPKSIHKQKTYFGFSSETSENIKTDPSIFLSSTLLISIYSVDKQFRKGVSHVPSIITQFSAFFSLFSLYFLSHTHISFHYY